LLAFNSAFKLSTIISFIIISSRFLQKWLGWRTIPEEIIKIILSNKDITIQDFVNFSSICTRFHNMVPNVNGDYTFIKDMCNLNTSRMA